MRLFKPIYNKTMARIVGCISPLWSFLTEWTGRLYWLAVLWVSYLSPALAQKLAIRWLDRLAGKIRYKWNQYPEDLKHPGAQAEDNVPFTLAVISRHKAKCRGSTWQLQFLCRLYVKGTQTKKVRRRLKWT